MIADYFIKFLAASVILLLVITSAFAANIEIVTEQYPPFSYEKDGVISGVSTEIVRAVLEKSGFDGNITVMRWANAYRRARRQKNVLIYSIGRTKERENNFHWVGVVAPFDMHIYSLRRRGDVRINSLSDARNFTVGVVRGDMRDQYFSSRNWPNIKRYSDSRALLEALFRHEIDFFAVAELNFPYLVDILEYERGDFEKGIKIDDFNIKGLYMAFSIQTRPAIVERFRIALEKVRKSGQYDAILKKYLR